MADGTIKLMTEIDDSGIKGGISNITGAIGKIGAVAVAAGATATAALVKSATDSYASYEQLVGGVDTLFKGSSAKVQEYARNAYQTAGLSANQYMETVTSFSASLLQSLGGDTEKAAEVADMAITDMADNANKMGTSMESIQNAYQGFAKQNYTMLDNLKLGYGGTKEEMQRLLADAEKISGIHYDISNLNDVYQAIHVIQGELGITGTTAEEAGSTIEGSANAMKAAWQNMLTAIAGGGDADFKTYLDALIDSVTQFASNVMPIIEQSLQGVAELIGNIAPLIIEKLPALIESLLPPLLESVGSLINSIAIALPNIITAIVNALPDIIQTIVDSLVNLIPNLVEGVKNMILAIVKALPKLVPILIDGAVQIVVALAESIDEIIPPLIQALPTALTAIVEGLIRNIPILIEGLISLIVGLVENLSEIIVPLIEALPYIVEQVVQALIENAPILIEGVALVIIALVAELPTIVKSLIEAFKSIGKSLIDGLIEGLKKLGPELWKAIKDIGHQIVVTIKEILGIHSPSTVFAEIGKNLLRGLVEGIKSMATEVWDALKNVANTAIDFVKDIFGIHSPSRVFAEIGEMLDRGLAGGVDSNLAYVVDSMGRVGKLIIESAKKIPESVESMIKDASKDIENAYKSLVEDTRSEVEKATDESNKRLLYSEEYYLDLYEDLKNSESEADKIRLKEAKEYSENVRKMYDARQKDIENHKKNIVNSYTELSKEILKNIEDVQKAQQKMEDKLSGFGKYTETIKDEETERTVLANLEEQNKTLEKYYMLLQDIKQRNVPAEFMSVIQDMSVEEGLQFAELLTGLSDEEFNKYLAEWQRKQELASNISKSLYSDQVEKIADSIDEQFAELSKDFYGYGEDSASDYGIGFINGLNEIVGNLKGKFGKIMLGMMPNYDMTQIPDVVSGKKVPLSISSANMNNVDQFVTRSEFGELAANFTKAVENRPITINFSGNLSELARMLNIEINNNKKYVTDSIMARSY